MDRKLIKSITISTIVYSLYRFDVIPHDNWSFVNIYKSIKFCDSLFAITLIYYTILAYKHVKLLTRVWNFFKIATQLIYSKSIHLKNEERKNTYIYNTNDSAINTPSEDLLNYYPSVKLLLKRITEGSEYFKDRAMCIGITAPWGSGKTSYLNLLHYAVEKDKSSDYYNKAIIVKFNPWFSSTPDRMIQDFMTTLSDALNKYNPNISSELIYYSRILSKAQFGLFSKIIDIYLNTKEDVIEKQFLKISECMNSIKIPIIIFIDDIDRLLPEEIMRILQLARNTANFKNTIFIIPYDKNHINKSLIHYNIELEYLEKIFTHPHYLPPLSEDKMISTISNIIAILIIANNEEKNTIDDFLHSITYNINVKFNIRQIKRLVDQISFSQSRLLSQGLKDMNLYDLLLIEYIKLEFYDLYEIISNVSDLYLDNVKYITDENICKRVGDLTDIKFYNENIYPQLSNKISKESGLKLLRLIFDQNERYKNSTRLMHPNIFRIYFEK